MNINHRLYLHASVFDRYISIFRLIFEE